MDRFVSTFTNRIDAKGRVSIPAPFRAVLERDRYVAGLYEPGDVANAGAGLPVANCVQVVCVGRISPRVVVPYVQVSVADCDWFWYVVPATLPVAVAVLLMT